MKTHGLRELDDVNDRGTGNCAHNDYRGCVIGRLQRTRSVLALVGFYQLIEGIASGQASLSIRLNPKPCGRLRGTGVHDIRSGNQAARRPSQ